MQRRLPVRLSTPAQVRAQSRITRALAAAALAALGYSRASSATELYNVLPGALDQPRVYAYVGFGNLDPQVAEDPFGFPTFTIEGFLDTGASGVLIAREFTYDEGGLGVFPQTFGSQRIVFSDVGADGVSNYYVSGPQSIDGSGQLPMRIGVANYNPATAAQLDNLSTYQQVYSNVFTNIRAQLTQQPSASLLGPFNVFGMPVMQGKVVVMDPRPVDVVDQMRTYIYDPGTPYTPETIATDPGIPTTSRQVKLSYADVSRFTLTSLEGTTTALDPSLGATLNPNPFIGPNPMRRFETNPPPDNTPPVKVSYNNRTAEASFLLDTGAAASMISTTIAGQLGVRLDPNSTPEDPKLLGVDPAEQFQLSLIGAGGTQIKVPGFFLDSMLLRTLQGNAANDADPNHFDFIGAPVLVFDITVEDPDDPGVELTLDGIFGMNNLVASALTSEGEILPVAVERGNFKWITFDQPNGLLGLEYREKLFSNMEWAGRDEGVSEWRGANNWYQGLIPIDEFPPLGDLVSYSDGDIVYFGDVALSESALNVHLPGDVFPGGVIFETDYDVDYVLYGAGKISGNTDFIKRGFRSVRIETSNNYTGPTLVEDGTLTFAAPQDIGDVTVYSKGKLVAETAQKFKKLAVQSGGQVAVQQGGAKMIDVTDVSVAAGGKVDLADNGMVVRATAATLAQKVLEVNDMVRRGRTGGTWDGDGLTSIAPDSFGRYLTTLGVALNDDGLGNPLFTSFMGVPVDLNSILVKFTWSGDLNLDGQITLDDYSILDAGYAAYRANPNLDLIYGDGDVDYDGDIDADDYWLIDHAFLKQTGTYPVMPAPPAPVPEPGIFGLASMVGLLAARRRVKR